MARAKFCQYRDKLHVYPKKI